jgi:uncharacterized protein
MNAPEIADRLALRQRPKGPRIMCQTWGKLLFLHWPFLPGALRRLVPPSLEIDTFDGEAWVGVTPFTMWGIRLPGLPPMPLLSRSHELNVRTYVHHRGVPGVWFLSLDAANSLAVLGARIGFHLPYFRARMHLEEAGERVNYRSHRAHPGAPPASFRASWSLGEPLPEAQPGTLDFFLIERYCLYSTWAGKLSRCRIHHRPWPLRRARVDALSSSMLEAQGLQTPSGVPLVHAQAAAFEVGIFRPRLVA